MRILIFLLMAALLFTHCCTFHLDMYDYNTRRCVDGDCVEGKKIDQTVWDRELPPYFDDTNEEGR